MSNCISVNVLLFARAVEIAGERTLAFRLPQGATIEQLKVTLLEQHPNLAALASVSRWAVGSEFKPEDHEILESTSIAMIPPVSGG